ncbi:hypothetical protein HMPREF0980_03156 [Dorea sp. D27]|nr:hypothetical protein HMPREF0980_03156 [Dorea sp. D27]
MNIVNNLETSEEGYALDARQGQFLNKEIKAMETEKAPIKSPQFNEVYTTGTARYG